MLLTADEISTLTGKKRRSAQRVVLIALGVPFKSRPDGSLVVLRMAAEAALGHAKTEYRPPQQPRLRLSGK